MEVLVFHERIADSYSSLELVNLAELAEKVIQSPEDYVFILSTKEWNEWLRLHASIGKKLLATQTAEEKWRELSRFAEENKANPFALISLVSAHPETGSRYKIGSLTPFALGDCYAVFYVKEKEAMKRAEEVRVAILSFREEQAKKPPLS